MTTTYLPPAPAAQPQFRRFLPSLLLLLTVFGPISMDLYLPALPALTTQLRAATSVAQLTVTACLIGLALGQLIAGPVSDQFGRRRVLLTGVVAYVITSALCAASPTMEALIAARFIQGLAGGVGIVIAQASGRDVFSGTRLIRFYGQLTVIGGLAAVIGPLLGGQLNTVLDWRGLFAFLALLGAFLLAVTAWTFPETLPEERRSSGGFAQTIRDYRVLLGDRRFLGAVLNQGFLYAALFAYLSGATYVLQEIYGMSPQAYAAAFGLNSAGFMVSGFLAGRAAERWSVPATLVIGVAVTGAGALGLLVTALTSAPLPVVIVSLFALASGVAVSSPPATNLALADWPQMAGTASSMLGMVRFGFGAISAPLVGLAGAGTVLPLGAVTTACVVLAAAAFAYLAARATHATITSAVTRRSRRVNPSAPPNMGSRPIAAVIFTVPATAPIIVACTAPDRPRPTSTASTLHPQTPTMTTAHAASTPARTKESSMRIEITVCGQTFNATLRESPASQDLIQQLPQTVEMRDHGTVEKTGRLRASLSLDGQPRGADPAIGDVGYYAPGQDFVLYYGDQSYYDGIVILGRLEGDATQRLSRIPGPVTAHIDRGN